MITMSDMEPKRVDIGKPLPLSAAIENATPTKVTIVFDEPLDITSVPAGADFSSTVGKTFTVAVKGEGKVVLTANTAYVNGDAEVITHTPGTNKIKDNSGNTADAFTTNSLTGHVVNNIV